MKRWAALIMIITAICMAVVAATPRNSKSVRKQRTATEQKIARTRSQINRNSEEIRRELLSLQSLEADIEERNSELAHIRTLIKSLDRKQRLLADTIEINSRKIDILRESYAKALRAGRRQRSLASKAAYIFSSQSFTQARSRMRYLNELRSWQKEKSEELTLLNTRLTSQRLRLDTLKMEAAAGADSIARIQASLEIQHDKADAVVKSLKRQKKDLDKVLKQQIDLARRLDDELTRAIEEEERLQREAERKQSAEKAESKKDKPQQQATKTPRNKSNTESTMALTAPFAQCKGKLPHPVDRKASVVSSFGRHAHGSLSKVQVQNNGIDFETSPGASARAVYDGVVSMVIVMDGYQNVVMLRHGKYLTVYAGIGDLNVRKGQKVKAGDTLGTIYSDPADNGRTRLHFEIRNEKEKLNPADWLE